MLPFRRLWPKTPDDLLERRLSVVSGHFFSHKRRDAHLDWNMSLTIFSDSSRLPSPPQSSHVGFPLVADNAVVQLALPEPLYPPSPLSSVACSLHLGTALRRNPSLVVHIRAMSDSQEWPPWSDNPNAPKIPYRLYFDEKANFAGTFISVVFYGAPETRTPHLRVRLSVRAH